MTTWTLVTKMDGAVPKISRVKESASKDHRREWRKRGLAIVLSLLEALHIVYVQFKRNHILE